MSVQVSTSIEVSSRKSSTPKEKSAREGGSTPVGPSHAKQHQAFGKALRSTADLQSGVRLILPFYIRVLLGLFWSSSCIGWEM